MNTHSILHGNGGTALAVLSAAEDFFFLNMNKRIKCIFETYLNEQWQVELDITRHNGSSSATGCTALIISSCQDDGFAHHLVTSFETIGILQVQRLGGATWESRTLRNSRPVPIFSGTVCPHLSFFPLFSHLRLIGQRPLVKERARCCSNIKVTGGDLPCGVSVRLTVTQFTDSQTTRDPCGSLLLLLLLLFSPTCQTQICGKNFFFFYLFTESIELH